MASAQALTKENDRLETKIEGKEKKMASIMQRGVFVGGAVGGAAMGAMLDLRFGSIWGFKPSTLIAAVAIGAVMADKVSKKNEDLVLAIGLGMAAKPVYEKTVETIGEGLFGSLFGESSGG